MYPDFESSTNVSGRNFSPGRTGPWRALTRLQSLNWLTLMVIVWLPVVLSTRAGQGTATGTAPEVSGRLWVTNQALNNVVAFNARTGEVLATIAVGSKPIGIAAPRESGKVYVANESGNSVSVISTDSFLETKRIDTGLKPHHMYASPDGRYVFVAEFGANSVIQIDTLSDAITARYFASPNSADRTHAASVTEDGKLLLAANATGDTLAAIRLSSGKLLWTLPVGLSPNEVRASKDGRFAYVTVRNENKLKIVRLSSSPAIVASVDVGPNPETIQMDEDGEFLMIATRGSPSTLAVVSIEDWEVSYITLPGITAAHNAIDPDGRYSFVAVEGAAPETTGISVADNRNRTAIGFYLYPGGGKPHGIAFEELGD